MMNYGWVCPKCGRAYAPFVAECKHCADTATSTPWTQVEHIYRPENGPTCMCGHTHDAGFESDRNVEEVCNCACDKAAEVEKEYEKDFSAGTEPTPLGGITVRRYKDGKEVETKNYTFEDLFNSMAKEIQEERAAKAKAKPIKRKNFDDAIEEAIAILSR